MDPALSSLVQDTATAAFAAERRLWATRDHAIGLRAQVVNAELAEAQAARDHAAAVALRDEVWQTYRDQAQRPAAPPA